MCKFCAATSKFVPQSFSSELKISGGTLDDEWMFSKRYIHSTIIRATGLIHLWNHLLFVSSTILLFSLHSSSHCSSFLGQMNTISKISQKNNILYKNTNGNDSLYYKLQYSDKTQEAESVMSREIYNSALL